MPWSWKRKATLNKSHEEQQQQYIEQIAYELYQNRMLLGKAGDAHKDWQTAERIVKNPLKTVLFASHRPFIKLEKQAWEPLLKWADNQALLSLLGIIGNVGLILAVVTYVGSEKQRRDAEVRNAWQTITSAHGQAGSGGRIEALEFLNASPGANWRRRFPWFCAPHPVCTWRAESLQGINLGVEPVDNINAEQSNTSGAEELGNNQESIFLSNSSARVYLVGLQLPNADLKAANLEGVDLSAANLRGADLREANLEGVDLSAANLRGAFLRDANLEGADLSSANLRGADLDFANLEGADLSAVNLEEAFLDSANLEGADLDSANLEGAVLWRVNLEVAFLGEANLEEVDLGSANLEGAVLWAANLEGADLWAANLQGAVLSAANLEGAVLSAANLEGAVELRTDQLISAKLCVTKLPDRIQLDPNRDCEELGIDPEVEQLYYQSR